MTTRPPDNHPGHAEAVEVIFDPERTSYRDILEFFFQIHRPDLAEGVVGSDYRSERTSEEQRHVAVEVIADADASGLWPRSRPGGLGIRSLLVRRACDSLGRLGCAQRSFPEKVHRRAR